MPLKADEEVFKLTMRRNRKLPAKGEKPEFWESSSEEEDDNTKPRYLEDVLEAAQQARLAEAKAPLPIKSSSPHGDSPRGGGVTWDDAQRGDKEGYNDDDAIEVLQRDDIDQTQYELSHVVYFPNLLFHAIHAHLGL